MNVLLLEHVAKYHFTKDYVYGRMLDFASGSGYGIHIIAKSNVNSIEEVVGIDINEDAVKYAHSIW